MNKYTGNHLTTFSLISKWYNTGSCEIGRELELHETILQSLSIILFVVIAIFAVFKISKLIKYSAYKV